MRCWSQRWQWSSLASWTESRPSLRARSARRMTTMADLPNSAADPRPGGRPAFIDPNCKACGTALVLHDSLREQPSPPDEVWHDEWECPTCRDGLHLDRPERRMPKGVSRWADI